MSRITEAIAELQGAQKSSKGAPAYSRFINRPFGRVLAAVAHTIGLSPNTVTMISGTVTYSGIAVILLVDPTWWSSLLITGLLVLGYALDSADGQVARLQGGGSLAGEWLDHMADSLKMSSIHIAVLVSWFRFTDLSDGWLVVPVVFQVAASVFFFGVILTELLRRISSLQHPEKAPAAAAADSVKTSAVYAIAVLPADYGLLCLVFLTLWVQPLFVAIYTTLAAINTLLLVASLFRWFRSVKSLKRAG
ncbi:MAG: CDP-alcohol phosphatidyltransferase family protein [Microthrixaceae bacterium]